MAKRKKKLLKVQGPKLRLTSKGLKVDKPRARIGGKAGINLSSKGVSGSYRGDRVTVNTKRGVTTKGCGCMFAGLAIALTSLLTLALV